MCPPHVWVKLTERFASFMSVGSFLLGCLVFVGIVNLLCVSCTHQRLSVGNNEFWAQHLGGTRGIWGEMNLRGIQFGTGGTRDVGRELRQQE